MRAKVMLRLTLTIHWHVHISDLTVDTEDFPKMFLFNVFGEFLNNNLLELVDSCPDVFSATFVLLTGEGLLVLRSFRRGEGDRGEMERRGLDGDLDRESADKGERERVRSRPRETGRDGMVVVWEI